MADLAKFIARWEGSSASEQQTKDQFLLELCDELGVPGPEPASGDPSRDNYVFEYPVRETDEHGKVHTKRIDLYRAGHFLLEAKQGAGVGAKKTGTAKRGTNAWHLAMNEAYGQALGYARMLEKPVPLLVVCDIGYCFDIYQSFDGSGAYRHFPTAQTSRLYLRDLEKHADTLRRVFTDPLSLDPSRKAAKVTREVAEYLANLAKNLEDKGYAQETVARFLMRCLFTMFAEDIELLPDKLFTRLLSEHWIPHPKAFPGGVEALWETMNTGGDMVLTRVRNFNGGLFSDTAALPLDDHALRILLTAATHDWSDVEPAIFGTLLERALHKKERHRLGAHYTPRAYVERLVRPTIEEPLRAEWDVVQAEVAQVRAEEEKAKGESAKKKKRNDAIKRVHSFHKKLCETRVLDPACGSGNFLYVALHLFQQIESEIWNLLSSLGESQDVLRLQGLRVTPAQFLGIEIKPWAKEIAELVLWIGYLQWHYRMLGKKPPVFEPVLHDYKNIESRDAILAYDSVELVTDEKGKPISRWDGETTKIHPVTGKEVPDDSARVPVYKYLNPRKAEWPTADFIIGNPPFIGKLKTLATRGEGYMRALRNAYVGDVEDSSDYVMYWWHLAALGVRSATVRRFGFVSTNSIGQIFNRRLLRSHLVENSPVHLSFAIPDHPWVDEETAADVRIAMTVAERGAGSGLLMRRRAGASIEDANESAFETISGVIREDLSVGPNVAGCMPLRSNQLLASPGVEIHGPGFVLTPDEAGKMFALYPGGKDVVKEYRIGRDLTSRNRGSFVIDLNDHDIEGVQRSYPHIYQRVYDHVRPERVTNREVYRREKWWLFARRNVVLRNAIRGLPRYIGTVLTARHRVFLMLSGDILPDQTIVGIGLQEGWCLGVLSSRSHGIWALAAGARLGVGNDPRYTKTRCFDPFPFPDPPPQVRSRIADLAESLDKHRKDRQAAHPDLTITGMYNVLEKLKGGQPLSEKEATIHEKALVSVLKKIHDDLDAAVFEAYAWPPDLTDEQILEKLVALNVERAEEERRGMVRWLRPDFQNPTGKGAATQTTLAGTDADPEVEEPAPVTAKPWPKKMADQIGAIRDLLAGKSGLWTAGHVAGCFIGAKPADVTPVLESLATLGLLLTFDDEEAPRWRAV